MKNLINKVNVSKVVCDHLIGEEHTQRHRMITGLIIIVLGVGISKIPTSIHVIHWMADAVGYGVHGLGCVPFIERFLAGAKKSVQNEVNKLEGED